MLLCALVALALAAPAAPAAAAGAPEPYDTVSSTRWGLVRFGDTVREARRRGAHLRFDPDKQDFWYEHGCGYATVVADDRKIGSVMVWNVDGRAVIKRAEFYKGYDRNVPTASGVEFGMTERALLRRAQRRDWDITVRRNPYGEAGEHEIIHRTRTVGRRTFAYKFLTEHRNGRTIVVSITAGHRDAVRLIEGCV